MNLVLVKTVCDLEIVRGKVKLDAGAFVTVLRRFDGESWRGQPTLLGWHDAVALLAPDGFFVRPWEYVTDLNAEVAALAPGRIENQVKRGYAVWIAEPARKRSAELDSGGHWKLHGVHTEHQTWRVSWIVDTGELYAVDDRADEFILLGKTKQNDEARAEFFVEGWSNAESPVYDNLWALREQILVRSVQPTPRAFIERYARKAA